MWVPFRHNRLKCNCPLEASIIIFKTTLDATHEIKKEMYKTHNMLNKLQF